MSVNLVYETTHLSRISKWLDITDRLRARLIEANTQYYKLVAQEEQGRGLTRSKKNQLLADLTLWATGQKTSRALLLTARDRLRDEMDKKYY